MITAIGQTGQCQCGAIRYRLAAEPLTLYACHCLHCQKQSSSAFGMSLWMRLPDIEFLQGEPAIWVTHGDSGAAKICAYCRDCGSRLYHGNEADATVSLKPGTLTDTSWLRPIAHIWTSRAQPWLNVEASGLPCYPKDPDDDEDLIRLWVESRA